MKNIIICLDGTGNRIRAGANTNVVKLFGMLDHRDRRVQISYYEPGVGTFSSARAWTPLGRALSRGLGLAFGAEMLTDIEEAYRYLMNHWEPGDRIFLFGFSRGAYCACAITALLNYIGLLRPGSDNLIQYAVSEYTGLRATRQSRMEERWHQGQMFTRLMSQKVGSQVSIPVAFLGIWDAVNATGVLRRGAWPYTAGLPNVLDGRHALSLDEVRRPYRPHPIRNTRIQQVWFAGVHSDVGGGYPEQPALSDISLKWMTVAATSAGLHIRPGGYPRLSSGHATAEVHRAGPFWALLSYRGRPVPRGALIHASVRDRIRAIPAYRHLVGPDAVFVDEAWLDGPLPD